MEMVMLLLFVVIVFAIAYVIKLILNCEKCEKETIKNKNSSPLIPNGYAIGYDGLPYKTNCEYGWGVNLTPLLRQTESTITAAAAD